MNEDQMKDVLENIARRAVPESTNLWPHIAAHIERKSLLMTLRTRPVFALLMVLLALALISGVAYAVGKLAGYIPGVGIVDQSTPLRILAEPLVVENDGLTITVSEVVADSDHTFVAYTVDGIIVPAESRPVCGAVPSLLLPDGSALNVVNMDDGGPRGARVGSVMKLEQSVTYSSVPADVHDVTLTFPCILLEGTGPENWQIPLKLSPAPKDYATPAVEIGVTFVASNPEFAPTPTLALTPKPADPTVPAGSGLYLDKVIELPTSYILVGIFRDAGDLPGPLEVNLDPYADLPHIEDGTGNPIAFKVRDDIQPEINNQYWGRHWAYEIAKPVQGPVTITWDQVNIAASDTTQFKFEAGSNPQEGQKWVLNLPIHLRAYDYVIDSVEVIKDGYLIKYHSDTEAPAGVSLQIRIVGVSLDQQNNLQNNGTLVDQGTTVEYSESLVYPAPLPIGQVTVELSLTESEPLQGPWKLTWTPPSK